MRLYRVAWADPGRWDELRQSQPGHPLHVVLAQQGAGRFDNPSHFAALYLARSPAAAVGETHGHFPVWSDSLFTRPKDELVRVLVECEVRGDPDLVDLDDTTTLDRLALRPSDAVRRNVDLTQEVALRLWAERDETGMAGIAWWSYWRPDWRPVVLWSQPLDMEVWFPQVEVSGVERLTVDHPAVTVAADVLPRHVDGDSATLRR